ncbi:MAG TPA: PspC domain-containing protein [Gaiellaceae bacterium]|jgi:phage shock protein PspC (stress-responsive transcriptional regulator)
MSEHSAEQPAVKRLERSRSDRMLAGVSGGLARYFGMHPAFYRVGFVVLALIGGAGILIYLAAALVIPDEGKEDSIASAALRERRDHPLPVIGVGIAAVAAAVLLSRVSLWPSGDAAWVLLLIGGGLVFLLTRRRGTDKPVVPTAAPAAGDPADAPTLPAVAVPARRGRFWRTLLIVVGSLLALLLVTVAVFVAVFPVHLSRGVGNETYVPASAADLRRSYSLGVGDLFVDLRNIRLPVGETKLTTRVDVGGLRVIVPPGAAVRVKADVRLGYLNLFGEADDGRNVDDVVTERGARVLVLDAHVGAGSVRVSRHLP